MQKLYTIIASKKFLKCFSLFLGCCVWYFFGNLHHRIITISVPLYFYGIDTKHSIDAPSDVTISIEGPRNTFLSLDTNSLALHVDGTTLKEGKQPLNIFSQAQLFVPSTIKLIDSNPHTVIVTLSKLKNEEYTR